MATIPGNFESPGSAYSPSRPSKLAWGVGAVLFVLFVVFVLSQSATMVAGQ